MPFYEISGKLTFNISASRELIITELNKAFISKGAEVISPTVSSVLYKPPIMQFSTELLATVSQVEIGIQKDNGRDVLFYKICLFRARIVAAIMFLFFLYVHFTINNQIPFLATIGLPIFLYLINLIIMSFRIPSFIQKVLNRCTNPVMFGNSSVKKTKETSKKPVDPSKKPPP